MNVKTTLAAIRNVGMSASHRDGEYRISYPAHEMPSMTRREETACYTNDAQDAIGTAISMRTWKDDSTPTVERKRQLVHEIAGPLQIGAVVYDHNGEPATVTGISEPHHEGSTGRIHTDAGSYFPSVFGYEWK